MAFAAFIPLIVEAIPAIVKLVEKAFPRGEQQPPTGQQKQSAALEMIKSLLEKMKKDGRIGDTPSDDMIRGMIDAIVQQLNKEGGFTPSPVGGDLFILRGTVSPLKV